MIRTISFHYHIQRIDNGYNLEYHDVKNSYYTRHRHFSKFDSLLKFLSKIELARKEK